MKTNLTSLIFMIALLAGPESFSQYISGYSADIRGEIIRYDCQQPDADSALLVRSLEERKSIEWFTASVPAAFSGDTAVFLMIAGIDVNPDDPHSFRMSIDGEEVFEFSSPGDTTEKNIRFVPLSDYSISFVPAIIDKYGDLFGYLFLKVPPDRIQQGMPLRISVTGETAGSRTWFMVFRYLAIPGIQFKQEEAVTVHRATRHFQVSVEVLHFASPAEVTISLGRSRQSFPIGLGYNQYRIAYPYEERQVEVEAMVRLNDRVMADTVIILDPVKPMTVYLLPHSHVDIGYTHVQDEVEKIQWQNLEKAVELSERTADYPEGSVFKWNSEVIWAVDSYLAQAGEVEIERLSNAIKMGWLGMDALYANILTGLCRDEELHRMVEPARKIGERFGVRMDAAMISDIPGYTWGLVDALSQNGIRYFSVGTNTFHRIGNIIEQRGDKPFYWRSASGEDSVLCWVHGRGYSEFHTGLGYAALQNKLKDQRILDYMAYLRNNGYAWDMVPMRYNIGSDNGPPDAFLSEIVRNWNERYYSPKLHIATTSEFFQLFEEKYGRDLPSFSGDFTGYWEDGACSSAKETAMSREAAERLMQAEAIWALSHPGDFPADRFSNAWKNVLLFSEHTWGSWNSISEPLSDFTLQQWDIKKSFAEKAVKASEELLFEAFPGSFAETVTSVDVINTCSWERTDLATVPASCNLRGEIVRDENGETLPSQRLSTGELVFVAESVPPLGMKRYYLEAGRVEPVAYPREANSLSYSGVTLGIDPETGSVNELTVAGYNGNYAGTSVFGGLNEYVYIEGRLPEKQLAAENTVIAVKEYGPVLMSVGMTSEAPGCNRLERNIIVVNGLERIDLENILDKREIYDPEAVHFVYPFDLDDAVVRINQPWGYYIPGIGQIDGSNRNFFSAHRWVDVSGNGRGITFVSRDAPLIELGNITNDATEYGWVAEVPHTATILSYVMNNYWETNYKASQGGIARFRYSLFPHGEFDPVQAERDGISVHQPLVVVPSDPFMDHFSAGFILGNENVLVASLKPARDGEGLLMKVYNPAQEDQMLQLQWKGDPYKLYRSDPMGLSPDPIENEIEVPSFGTRTLLLRK